MQLKGQTIGTLKIRCHWETIEVPLMEILYLGSLIQLGLMYPPFWFSMLESNKATLISLEEKH